MNTQLPRKQIGKLISKRIEIATIVALINRSHTANTVK